MTVHPQSLPSLLKLRQLLSLLSRWRDVQDSLATPAGLRAALQLLLDLAALFEIDAAWIARAQALLDQPALFNVVLAVVQYALTLAGGEVASPKLVIASLPAAGAAQAQDIVEWLPELFELLQTADALRGGA